MAKTDIARACAYPYHIPERSYVLDADGCRELREGQPAPDLSGLHAVIASGSNQSPQQLARKFDFSGAAPMPVLRSRIVDFDAVYSPHFSSYGSIPATLHHCPGAAARLFTTWLNDGQLQRMHETEALGLNYDFGRLEGIRLQVDGLGERRAVYAYIGRRGALRHGGRPVALAAVAAAGRQWPAMSQRQVQAVARDRLSPGLELDRFIAENITQAKIRGDRATRLAANAMPFSGAVLFKKT